MDKKKIIIMIILVVLLFVVINVVAKSFCNPAKEDTASTVTTFVEKTIPKQSGFDLSNMRLSWILFFSKFCENGASNQKF